MLLCAAVCRQLTAPENAPPALPCCMPAHAVTKPLLHALMKPSMQTTVPWRLPYQQLYACLMVVYYVACRASLWKSLLSALHNTCYMLLPLLAKCLQVWYRSSCSIQVLACLTYHASTSVCCNHLQVLTAAGGYLRHWRCNWQAAATVAARTAPGNRLGVGGCAAAAVPRAVLCGAAAAGGAVRVLPCCRAGWLLQMKRSDMI